MKLYFSIFVGAFWLGLTGGPDDAITRIHLFQALLAGGLFAGGLSGIEAIERWKQKVGP